MIASALDLSAAELTGCAPSKMIQECCQKKSNLNMLTDAIKEKLKIANNKEKVKLLTITPVSWSIQQTADFFCVSTAMVKKAKNLQKTNVILSEPKEKTGRLISDELKQAVEISINQINTPECVREGRSLFLLKLMVSSNANRKDCCYAI